MRAPSRDEKWIDADYLGWPDDGRREIIEGHRLHLVGGIRAATLT